MLKDWTSSKAASRKNVRVSRKWARLNLGKLIDGLRDRLPLCLLMYLVLLTVFLALLKHLLGNIFQKVNSRVLKQIPV